MQAWTSTPLSASALTVAIPVTVLQSTTAGTGAWSAPEGPSVTEEMEEITALSSFYLLGTVAEQG
jgi:hypothetical protein